MYIRKIDAHRLCTRAPEGSHISEGHKHLYGNEDVRHPLIRCAEGGRTVHMSCTNKSERYDKTMQKRQQTNCGLS